MPVLEVLGEVVGTIASGTSVTVTKPTDAAIGDEWIIFLSFTNASPGTMTWPAGFTAITGATEPLLGTGHSGGVRRRRIDGTEGASVNVSWTTTTSGTWVSFRVPGSAGIEAAATNTAAATTSHVAPTVTPLGTQRLLVALFGSETGGVGVAITWDAASSGMTEEAERAVTNTACLAVYSQDLDVATAATGTRTVTASASIPFVAYSLLFAPAEAFVVVGSVYVPLADAKVVVGGVLI
jgi:hypothetical protein